MNILLFSDMINRADKISLAMPTYNGARFLREQLDSIYSQTMVPDEVIVVDDCSTDGTVNILEEYHQKFGLKYYINETNLGYNRNFEKAIRLCTGDYIALSDQDDVWFSNKIEVSYNKIIEYPIDEPALISSFCEATDENLNPISHTFSQPQSGDWKLNLTRYYAQGCTLMMNKALLKYILPIPDEIIYDAYIGIVASMIGNRYYIGEKLMYYRLHGGNSLAFDKPKSQFSVSLRIQQLKAFMPFWYTKNEQYRYLHIVKHYHESHFIKDRISTMDKVIKIFEVGKIRRLILFLSLDGPNFYQKARTTVGLLLKMIFFIKDEY